MYPNLYFAVKDWFGWEVNALKIFYTFGIFVAIGFIISAWVLTVELRRKEKQGLLKPCEETITTGEPATLWELFINFAIGFLFGYKLIGAFIASRQEGIDLQEFIFSKDGSWLGGFIIGGVMLFLKYRERNKQKLAKPEKRTIRIWPHDRVGDIVIYALVFGIIGAKLFDNLENWDRFIQNPIANLLAPSGLTFYGGLIFASIAILIYAKKKRIKLLHLLDAAAPALMIAYAIGRIGCQVAGDGDWGIYNSAYITQADGSLTNASMEDFKNQVAKYPNSFKEFGAAHTIPQKYVPGYSALPIWFVAQNFKHNVNNDGIPIEGYTGDYSHVLPVSVFPTSMYETIFCFFLFLLIWFVRKKFKLPLQLFGFYLILNGLERFFIEKIRVNYEYDWGFIHPSQAEIISSLLILAGLLLFFMPRKKKLEGSQLS